MRPGCGQQHFAVAQFTAPLPLLVRDEVRAHSHGGGAVDERVRAIGATEGRQRGVSQVRITGHGARFA
ncbi:hypothetical protein DF19_23985 [Streptomyces olindensis]|nr:hypothetical protein DF19_23985 [Streptomyces olindensis]